jgi:hypothetical protein
MLTVIILITDFTARMRLYHFLIKNLHILPALFLSDVGSPCIRHKLLLGFIISGWICCIELFHAVIVLAIPSRS